MIKTFNISLAIFFFIMAFTSPIKGINLEAPKLAPLNDLAGKDMVKEKPHIVFLISEDPNNYEAHITIPPFAESLEKEEAYKVTVILAEGPRNSSSFPGLEVLSDADLLVVFCRRLAIPIKQLKAIQSFIDQGKPMVGIRTANHAFSVREGKIPEGYQDWAEFVPEILGSENRGYGPEELGTLVKLKPGAGNHPILKDVTPLSWQSKGNVYLTAPLLDKEADVLLTGTVGEMEEPIAWTRNAKKSRVFYTSLGHPSDFEVPQFRKLLTNGIKWALGTE